ncbi:Glucosamine-phosphate N-acetyltransferase protein [Dioscorea alata]|uniref:Glucosamine-phosphate N-acetyltransferase protein n=1 Tax=Dioscorea alata TaxID=55571 RepID=A0ACB7U1N9_DIOAL|nr:Glucosamine-phosphate N-acetyltransferase protein [Dioscorea alata]
MAAFAIPAIASSSSLPRRRPPPIYISTNPSHLDPLHLRDLFLDSNHSCFRFPKLSLDGRVEPMDPVRLRKALAHSSIVVSVFCRTRFLAGDDSDDISALGFRDLFERPPPESDRKLVGFGRAVSDSGLTASIHDVVVIPSLQRLGIGRKIVNRITRILTNKGIYDISALCSEKERLFFTACGFGDDSLGSTTMIYSRTASNYLHDDLVVKPAGRLLLVVPPARNPNLFKRIAVEVDKPIKAEKKNI